MGYSLPITMDECHYKNVGIYHIFGFEVTPGAGAMFMVTRDVVRRMPHEEGMEVVYCSHGPYCKSSKDAVRYGIFWLRGYRSFLEIEAEIDAAMGKRETTLGEGGRGDVCVRRFLGIPGRSILRNVRRYVGAFLGGES